MSYTFLMTFLWLGLGISRDCDFAYWLKRCRVPFIHDELYCLHGDGTKVAFLSSHYQVTTLTSRPIHGDRITWEHVLIG